MTEFDRSEPDRRAIREARALLNALSICAEEEREGQIRSLIRNALAPLREAGDPEADWLLSGIGPFPDDDLEEDDYDRLMQEARKQASDAGVPDAMFWQSCDLHERGAYEDAAELCKCAADLGHVHAIYCYGLDLYAGTGVAQDKALGVEYIRKAAEKRLYLAAEFMAKAHREGWSGFDTDEGKAAYWDSFRVNAIYE